MSEPADAAALCSALVRALPDVDVRSLAQALASDELPRLRATSGSASVRHACTEMADVVARGTDPQLLAGCLAGMVHERGTRESQVEVVWSGPVTDAGTGRLTSAAVVDLIAGAERELLLVGYAVHGELRVEAALLSAADRGVAITLLLERPQDNPGFRGGRGPAFPDLRARRLAWTSSQRPAGASLHAKVLVADHDRALVGSANITEAALDRNLECGVLLKGPLYAAALRQHIDRLAEEGHLVEVERDQRRGGVERRENGVPR